MLPFPPVPDPDTAWALFLDVDGTLLELAPTPTAVQVPAGLISLLLRLHHRLDGAVALISGRRIAVLDNLFKPLLLPAAGLHGFECRDARGVIHIAAMDSEVVLALRRQSEELARDFPGVLLEDKEFSVAFHYGAIAAQQVQLREAVRALAASLPVELLEGHKVYELKPAEVNKALALEQFMQQAPFAGRHPIFLGDDVTDKLALSSVRDLGGMAIQVDERIASSAQYGLANPRAALHWLRRWEEQLQ